MARKKIETIILEKIHPFTLNERGMADLSQLARQYSYELLIECIDIGVSTYFRYDQDGNLTRESVANFLDKLGGIAYNNHALPLIRKYITSKTKESDSLPTGIHPKQTICCTNT